jgi:4-amino-4-deoxy-L-arabinose transferase-like glycosyltransferase
VTALAEPIFGNKQRTRPDAFLGVLAIYFLIQILIRVWQGGAVEMDESEQIFYAQHFQLGYENQPPLYTWLQAAVFSVVGISHLGLAIAKNVFMFVLYASVYQVARRLIGRLGAAAVSSSLIMIITLGWEAQIDRTHSILATAIAAASLWAYYELVRSPSRARRVLLGALFGLGMLSKYNYLLFAIGVAGASLVVPEHRRVVWTRDVWITPLIALLVVLPHAYWFVGQLHAATAETLRKMHEGGSPTTYIANVLQGLKHFGLSILSFTTPLWLPLAFAWRGRKPVTPNLTSPDARFFLWLYACGFGVIGTLVLSGELVHIQSRWLQPLLFAFPLAFFVFFPPRSDSVYRKLLLTMGIFACVLIAALAFRPQLQVMLDRHPRIYQPYWQVADEIRKRFPATTTFIVQDRFVGGNLLLQFPHAKVVLMPDACAQEGRVLMLSGDGFDDRPRVPFSDCAGMAVLARGGLSERSLARPREKVAFDFVWADVAPP